MKRLGLTFALLLGGCDCRAQSHSPDAGGAFEDAAPADAGPDAAWDAGELPDAGVFDPCPDLVDAGSGCDVDDLDGDGFVSTACEGDDCDDSSADIHPGAPDVVEPGRWTAETLVWDAGLVSANAIAVEPDGTAHVAFVRQVDAAYREVIVASNSTGSWESELVATGGDPPDDMRGVSIALVGPGDLLVVYEVGTALRMASRVEGVWESEEISRTDARARWEVQLRSLAVDAMGRPSVLLAYPPRFVASVGERWAEQSLGSIDYVPRGLVFDLDGAAHVASDDGGDLGYFTNRSGTWVHETVEYRETTGYGPSLTLSPRGVAIVYMNVTRLSIRLAEGCPSHWALSTIESPADGPALTVMGPRGTMHVGWHSWRSDRARYGSRHEASWSFESIPDLTGVSALAVGQDGSVHVVGLVHASSHLVYARLADPRAVDQDCDGTDGIDADGDRWASVDSGGEDCRDEDATMFPRMTDVGYVEQDCGPDGPGM